MSIRRTLSALAGVLALAFTSTAFASLIAHESFDYAGTSADGQGAATDGWGGAWTLTPNGPDNLHAITDTSLAYPDGVALTPTGGRISNMSDEVLYRSLATPINTNPASPREVWISMLVQKTTTGRVDFGFEGTANGQRHRRLVWGFWADERFRVNVGSAEPFFATDAAFPVDEPLLVVVRLSLTNAATNTSDSMGLKVFRQGDTITTPVNPEDFDVHQANTTGVPLDSFFIDGANSTTQVDEIRIGDTFADVVPVPEPGAMSLLGGLGLLVLRRP